MARPMGELLRAERLTRRYVMGETVVTALDSVSASFDEGEIVAVVGRSGSGKSTLLHLIGGLDRPTSGEIRFRGRPLGELSEDERARYRRSSVGFVFQFFNLVPTLTAVQNVELPLVWAGVAPRERRRRAEELLERVGLSARREHRPGQLSGGEQQRVAVARALANDPPLLLADEPTGNLDSRTAGELMDLLRSLEGKTIVFVTHDAALAASAARRILELRDGRLVRDEAR
jgi:putative ABC transport system ATP-binding protein